MTVLAMPDRAQTQFRFQGPERCLNFSEPPIGPQDSLQIPVPMAGAQHIGADPGSGIIVLLLAGKGDCGGFGTDPPGSGALGGSVLGSSALGDGVLGDLDIILLRYFRLSLLDETGTLLDPVIVF